MSVYVGHGHRGTVSMRTEHGVRVATKARRPDAPRGCIAHEAECLSLVNRHGIGPKLLECSADGESLRYVYVDGLPILEHCQRPVVGREEALEIFEQVLQQLVTLDRLRLNKHELTWPAEHILVAAATEEPPQDGATDVRRTDGEGGAGCRAVLIDFERCTPSAAKPKNVTQFLQFLSTPTVRGLLLAKGIGVDVPALRAFGSSYRTAAAATTNPAADGSDAAAARTGAEWKDLVGRLGLRRPLSSAEHQEHERQLVAAAEAEAAKVRRRPRDSGMPVKRRGGGGGSNGHEGGAALEGTGQHIQQEHGEAQTQPPAAEGSALLSGRAARRLAAKRARALAAAALQESSSTMGNCSS
eukprot:COSAG05_NODE_177_length_14916_cov_8.104002_2_plen_356_part_00